MALSHDNQGWHKLARGSRDSVDNQHCFGEFQLLPADNIAVSTWPFQIVLLHFETFYPPTLPDKYLTMKLI